MSIMLAWCRALSQSFLRQNSKRMKKYTEISEDVLKHIDDGKYVEGSLRRDKSTGKIIFKAFNRQSPFRHERVICQLENGWMKESPQRIKFFNSVKKELGIEKIEQVIKRELNTAMKALKNCKIENL